MELPDYVLMAWRLVFKEDPNLSHEDALEAGWIARDTTNLDAARKQYEDLQPLLLRALYFHHDGYTDYPWAEDCPACSQIVKFLQSGNIGKG